MNIEYMYAFTLGREDRAVMVFRFDRPDEATGYMRLSLTIPRGDIERALPGFDRAIRRVAADRGASGLG